MPLTIAPCRSLCDWVATPRTTAGARRLFACRGCGSQWERGQAWTPRQADGSWPAGVQEELQAGLSRPADAAGSAGS